MESVKKEELNIPVMVGCIVGIVLTIFGVLLLKTSNFKLNIISTEASVTGVTTATSAGGEVASRNITLSYKANGGNYTASVTEFNEEIDIGSTMTLYYDLISPESVSMKRTGYIGYLAVFIGIVLIIKTGTKFVKIIKDNYL